MGLSTFLTTAMLTIWPRMSPDTATRYANDIEIAVEADVKLAVALLVTMHAEANVRPEDIEHCICKPWECDRGPDGKPRALGLFQLQFYWWDNHSPEEICASNELSTQLAAKEMRFHLAMTQGNMHRALRRHVGWGVDPHDPRVATRPKEYDRLLAMAEKAGLQ